MTQTISQQLAPRRVALALSSGFFGFYHHAGVLRALNDSGIVPVSVSGTSAGALVAGMYGSGMSALDICEGLLRIQRNDFWDMQFPFTRRGFGWIAGNRLGANLSQLLPVHRFEDCPVRVALGVYRVRDGRSRVLTSGSLIDAMRASCAVPYMFSPVEIDGEVYWDGGFAEKTPLGHLVNDPDIDTVVISHLPPRESTGDRPRKTGLFSGLSFGVDTPLEERLERDQRAVALLREAGKTVVVLSPPRVWLGPFSMKKGAEAMEQGREGAMKILESSDLSATGCDDLR